MKRNKRMLWYARSARGGDDIPAFLILLAVTLVALSLAGCDGGDRPGGGKRPKGGAPGVWRYELVLLPPLAGDTESEARALNNRSSVEIVGVSYDSNHERSAIQWRYDEGTLTQAELPRLNHYDEAVANDINDGGTVSGACFQRFSGYRRPVLWTGLQVEDIYMLGHQIPGEISEATSIANPGHVVGWYVAQAREGTEELERPFAYLNRNFNTCRFQYSTKTRYNALDRKSGFGVVGYSYTDEQVPKKRAFLISDMADARFLPGLGGDESEAFDVAFDEDGWKILAVGTAEIPDGTPHAFLWVGTYDDNLNLVGEITDLGTLASLTHGMAFGVNTDRIVVGTIGTTPMPIIRPRAEYRAFIWSEAAGMLDLNDLLLPGNGEGVTLYGASDINEEGWIVGTCGVGNAARGFLLIPEPIIETGLVPDDDDVMGSDEVHCL